MANVQIYQLDNAGSDLDNSALLAMDIPNPDASAASEVPYVTRKASVSELETQMLQTEEYSTALDTTNTTIVGAINEQQSVIGYSYDEYDATTAYSKDDLCIYNNTLYKAKQATTGNLPTNTTYWKQTSIADEISELNGITIIGNPVIDNPFHITFESGWSCNDLMVSKYGNRIYVYGWFISTTVINSWRYIGRFDDNSIKPKQDLVIGTYSDDDINPNNRALARYVVRHSDGYFQASNDNPNALRIMVNCSFEID